MTARDLPTLAAWRGAGLGLRRAGRELVGPCPACGGSDRFRVLASGRFFCRQCCPDGKAGADAMRRIVEAAGFDWPEKPAQSTGERRTARSPVSGASDAPKRPLGDPARFQADWQGDFRRPERHPAGQSRASAAREGEGEGDSAVAGLWRRAIPDPGPVAACLSARGAWPPGRPLPDSVRWIARARLPERVAAGLPEGAAGCAVYAYRTAGLSKPDIQASSRPASAPDPAGVQLEPLAEDGARCPWPPRKPGGRPVARKAAAGSQMRGAAFRVPGPAESAAQTPAHSAGERRTARSPSAGASDAPKRPLGDPARSQGDGGALHVAEGPADALAIRTWRGVEAWASGGTNGVALADALAATGRAIVIEADGGGPGREAAADLAVALDKLGAENRIAWALRDPAEDLAADWTERAAIVAEGAGLPRREAEALAWNEPRPADRGGPAGRDVDEPPTDQRKGFDNDL